MVFPHDIQEASHGGLGEYDHIHIWGNTVDGMIDKIVVLAPVTRLKQIRPPSRWCMGVTTLRPSR